MTYTEIKIVKDEKQNKYLVYYSATAKNNDYSGLYCELFKVTGQYVEMSIAYQRPKAVHKSMSEFIKHLKEKHGEVKINA